MAKRGRKPRKKKEFQLPVEYKSSGFRFIRIFDFFLIPEYLIRQIKDVDWDSKRLYELGQYITKNPFTLLYVLADRDHKIRGFLWMMLNPLSECLFVHVLSIDPEYQNVAAVKKEIMEFLFKQKADLKLKTIKSATTRSKALERYGWKRSKHITMEV